MAKKSPITRRIHSKDSARRFAIRDGRKVLWKDEHESWHAATDRRNTPSYAVETEDL